MKVTVLGTGIMGSGVARVLASEGFEVTAWNRTLEHALPLESSGVRVEPDLQEAVVRADVVMVLVYDAPSVLDVLERSAGSAPNGTVWVQMATIGAAGAGRVAAFAVEHQLKLVETMMMGSKAQAESGSLTLIAGGDSRIFEQVQPVIDAISKKLVYCGPSVGDGTAVKLACNLWLAGITAAAGQSLELLGRQHIDPQLFLDVLEGATVDSPYAHLKGRKIIARDFAPQFEVNALLKDLGLVHEVMDANGFRTDLLERQQALYEQAAAEGHGRDDVSAVATAFDPEA